MFDWTRDIPAQEDRVVERPIESQADEARRIAAECIALERMLTEGEAKQAKIRRNLEIKRNKLYRLVSSF